LLGKRKGRSFCLAGRELVRIDSGRIVVTGEVRGWEYDPAEIALLLLSVGIKLARKLSESSAEPFTDIPEPMVRVPLKREVAVWRNGRIESWTEEY